MNDNDEIWDYERGKVNCKAVKLKNRELGIRVFEFIKSYEPDLIVNNYEKCNNQKVKQELIKFDKTQRYQTRKLDVRVKYWYNHPDYEDKMINITISEKVWTRLVLLSGLLKKRGYKQGKYIVYAKMDYTTVGLCFMTQEQFEYYKPILSKSYRRTELMDKGIYWYGYKFRYDHDRFTRFYGGGD